MATSTFLLQALTPRLPFVNGYLHSNPLPLPPNLLRARRVLRAAASASPKPTKPAGSGRKKSPSDSPEKEKPKAKTTTRRAKKSKKEAEAEVPKQEAEGPKQKTEAAAAAEEEVVSDYDDGADFPYEWPPLVCCFGAAQREFVPTVRVSERQMHPDKYSTWRHLQWDPPEFARAPGGPGSNVAVAHTRLGGRAAFMGKVGDDAFGKDLVGRMNGEKVQTRAVRFDGNATTGAARMRVRFDEREDGKGRKLVAETVKSCAEDSLLESEINVGVLKEARIFHFNSEVLLTPSMHPTLFRAINLSKKFGSKIFFDLNLPLPLWKSRDETRELINRAWNEADIIEVSREELEFLLDEDFYTWKRNTRPQYYLDTFEPTRNTPKYYHYTPDEIAPLWHDRIKILFVTYGTLRIHYYTPTFHGSVVGTEDTLITPYTSDRTGSGDAVVAAIMRKLATCPEMYEDQDKLERQLRFVVAAGIISQWTIGAVRGFPTEGAAQNLKEQVYVPAMW